jgi:hypothetical protein
VQLDDTVGGNARLLVQPVNVLRNHRRHPAAGDKGREGKMAAARPRLAVKIVHGELAPPCLTPPLRAAHKRFEGDRLVLHPRAAGGAKVWHAALGRNTGPGEAGDNAGVLHQRPQLVDLVRKVCGDAIHDHGP